LGVFNEISDNLNTFLQQTRSSQAVAPSLFEAARTLRFAVSRTF